MRDPARPTTDLASRPSEFLQTDRGCPCLFGAPGVVGLTVAIPQRRHGQAEHGGRVDLLTGVEGLLEDDAELLLADERSRVNRGHLHERS